MSETGRGYGFAIASAALSGANYAIGKVVLTQLSPIHFVALIFSIATLGTAGWTTFSHRWRDILGCSPRGWGFVLLFGCLSVGALFTLWSGIKHLDPTVAAFIGRLQTFVTVFMGIFLLGERFHLREGIGGAIILGGVVLIKLTFNVEMSLWFWVLLASAVLFGMTEVVAKLAVRHLSPAPLSFLRSLLVALFFLGWVLLKQQPLLAVGSVWWGVLAVGLTGPFLARLFYLYSLQYLEVSKSALINQTQPLFVAIIALSCLGLIPGWREWTGGGLILAGCVVLISGRF